MGRYVNVVTSDGRVVSVPEEVAEASGLPDADRSGDTAAEYAGQLNEERSSGVIEGLKAAGEGALDAATGGGYGKAREAIDPEGARTSRIRAQERPGARLAGEVGTLLAPTGVLGRGAKVATEFTLPGVAGKIGAAGKYGRAAEGAILGGAGHVSGTNVTGDDLTIAGTMEAATVGGLLDYGLGKLGDKFTAAGNKQAAKAKAAEELGQKAFEAEQLLEASQPKWETFRQTNEAHAKALKQNNDAAWREATARAKQLTPEGIKKAINKARDAKKQVQVELADTPTGRAAIANGRATRQYNEFKADTERVSKAFTQVDDAIAELEKRPGALDADEDDLLGKLTQMKAQADEGGKLRGGKMVDGDPGEDFAAHGRAGSPHADEDFAANARGRVDGDHAAPPATDDGEAFTRHGRNRGLEDHWPSQKGRRPMAGKPGTPEDEVFGAHARGGDHSAPVGPRPAPPVEPPPPTLAARLKEFRKRRSMASQKLGNYDATSSTWTKADGKLADPDAALAELAQLRDDIAAQFPSGRRVKLPDVPRPPTERAIATGDDALEIIELKRTAEDITNSIEWADAMSRSGKYEEAARELEALATRHSATRGDLVFHQFPKVTREIGPEGVLDLPKRVDQFAAMTDEKVARLTAHMDELAPDHPLRKSFADLAADLGLPPVATPSEIRESLRGYVKALRAPEVAELVRRRKSGIFGKVGDWTKTGIARAAGRHVDQGGAKGAIYKALAFGGAMSLMDHTEASVLGAAYFAGKSNIRARVAALVGKYGARVGRGVGRVAPVTAYLAASWPTGEPDVDDDVRKQAYNRIGDVIQAAMVAPDALYSALEGALGHPGDLAWKSHQFALHAINHLAAMAPRDPGLDVGLNGSNWRPTAEQSLAFAHRIEAVEDPLMAIERSIRGDGHPAAAETLWAVWGPVMQEFASEFMMADRSGLTMEAESRMAQLLRLPVGLRHPQILSTLQGQYLPPPEQAPPGRGGGSAPTGRPPAVQTPVAGSSVAGLTA